MSNRACLICNHTPDRSFADMTKGKINSRLPSIKVNLWQENRGSFLKFLFNGGAAGILSKQLKEATYSVIIRTRLFVEKEEETLVSALAKIPEGGLKNMILSHMFIFSFDNDELPSLPECLQHTPIVKSFQDTDSFWEQDFLAHIAELNVALVAPNIDVREPLPDPNNLAPNDQEEREEMADEEGGGRF